MSPRHNAGPVGHEPSVQSVVETGPLGKGEAGTLLGADEEYCVLGQAGIVQEGAYLAGEGIEVVDLGVIRHECLTQFGGVDPVRRNGELGGIEKRTVAGGVRRMGVVRGDEHAEWLVLLAAGPDELLGLLEELAVRVASEVLKRIGSTRADMRLAGQSHPITKWPEILWQALG